MFKLRLVLSRWKYKKAIKKSTYFVEVLDTADLSTCSRVASTKMLLGKLGMSINTCQWNSNY